MNPAIWAIRNNRTFILGILVLILLGIQNYLTIPRLEDPEFTIRTAIVTTVLPGAAPVDVERLVTEPLEERIRELGEVENVIAQSRDEMSILEVEVFERFKDMDPIWQDLRNKVSDARRELPEGVLGPSVNDDFGDVFGIVIALRGKGYAYRELEREAENIRDELLLVPDVAKVEIWGEQEERIFIEFSNARLAQLGINPAMVIDAVEAQNALVPAGSSLVGPQRITIEPTGEFRSIEEIRNLSLSLPGRAENIQLRDIATVSSGYQDPPRILTRFNGERSLMLAVSMTDAGKITELGELIDRRLVELESRLPLGLELDYLTYQPKFVEEAIDNFMINLYTAFGFVFLVMFLFTDLRTAFVAGLLVPMAMLTSIALMGPLGVALQRVSIASLIISLGILVDNGVVVSESILVRLSRGEERLRAVSETVASLAKPLLAASLTTIFAFLPIATARSDVGEYTFSLFLVITLTLLASWGLSMTFVPFLSHYVLKPGKSDQDYESGTYRTYRTFLLGALRHKVLTIVVIAALTAGAILAFRFVPEIFFPPNEREMFTVDFWQPYGTDITVTASRTARLEDFLLSQEGVVSVGSFVGSGGPRWYLPLDIEHGAPNYTSLVVNTETIEDVDRVIPATEAFLNENMPDTRADVLRLEHGPSVGAPIQVRISGPDMDILYSLRERIAGVLAEEKGIMDVWDDWGEWSKKMIIDVDQDKARRAGVSSQEIAMSLNAYFSGIEISQYRHSDDLTPIVIRSTEDESEALARIDDLEVYSISKGDHVPLGQVARPRIEWQPSMVRRYGGERAMTVKASVKGRFPSEIQAAVKPVISKMQQQDWPAGYRVEYDGEVLEQERAKGSVYSGLPLMILLIALTLVAKFNSFRRFLIIALTVPPMMVGVVAGLFLTGDPFGFMALLGVISLTGIIINNAILLVDTVEEERGKGIKDENALVMAAQQRLRPIIMTVTTTIMGLIPLSLRGGEMWSPLANVVIFGLFFSTILTLGLAPALYALFFRLDFRRYRFDPDLPRKTS